MLTAEVGGGKTCHAFDQSREKFDVAVAHHLGDLRQGVFGGGEQAATLHNAIFADAIETNKKAR